MPHYATDGLKREPALRAAMVIQAGKGSTELGYAAVRARRAGLSGAKVALIVVGGSACIFVLTFGLLAWGFRDFG
jgi:hypothetical protein